MSQSDISVPDRLDVIETLLRAARGELGRTAIMKCLFVLQEAERIPLGYKFQLYTYGPYDAAVLSDLTFAEQLGRIRSELVGFRNGNQGYRYRPASKKESRKLAQPIREKIERVARDFGQRSAADLEMASTILFVDRHHERAGRPADVETIVHQVREIKPHSTEDRIRAEVSHLQKLGYLKGSIARAA